MSSHLTQKNRGKESRLDTNTLASAATLCRWENTATRETAWTMHEVIIDQLITSYDKPPKRLLLDIDATDDRKHGMQEGRGFQG